jgi:hypothetical protein
MFACCWLRSKCGVFDKHSLHVDLCGSTLHSPALAKTSIFVYSILNVVDF